MEKGKFNDQFKIYAGNTHHPQHTRNTANNLLGKCLICLSEKIACDFQIYKHLSPLINFYLNATTKWTTQVGFGSNVAIIHLFEYFAQENKDCCL